MDTGQNGALGQSVIQLAAIGGAGMQEGFMLYQGRRMLKFVGLEFLQGKTVSGGALVPFWGQLILPDLLPPKAELVRLYVDLLGYVVKNLF
eukprot:15361982-Ditylum_brightwellii.AAC.1